MSKVTYHATIELSIATEQTAPAGVIATGKEYAEQLAQFITDILTDANTICIANILQADRSIKNEED